MSLDCFNKSSIDNKITCKNINNKKLKENHTKKSEKYKYFKNLKLKIYNVLILVISISSYVFFIKNKNFKNNWFSIKFNKNESQNLSNFNISVKKMKHAILVLSSYGLDYLNNFLYQFKNDYRFDIYIHISGKSLIDFENGETIINSNIKILNYIHNSKRFSIEMVDVMYDILSIANSKFNYDFYHFFSESCYLVKSLDYIYNYFFINKLNSYIEYNLHNKFLYNNLPNLLYKGSQWMSLNHKIVKKLLNRKDLFIKYKKEIKKGIIKIRYGAPDEFIFQHIIIKNICEDTPKKCNIKNNNLRFIRWLNCKNNEYCPNFLNVSNVSEEEINYIRKNCFVIRKINYKNPKAIELVNKIKSLS